MAAPRTAADADVAVVVVTRCWSLGTQAAGPLRTRLLWLRAAASGDGGGEARLTFAVPEGLDLARATCIGECRPRVGGPAVRVVEVPDDVPGLPPPPDVGTAVTARRVRDAGLWATLGDFAPAGGAANVFGIKLSDEVMAAWARASPDGLRALLHAHDAAAGLACPVVTYHGGPAALRASLAEPGGALREDAPQGAGHRGDPPMMGRGVYTGSYWKARRFALWSGDYARRDPPGAVVRVAAFVEAGRVRVHDTPRADPVSNAYVRRFFRTNPKRSAQLSLWIDHDGDWRRDHDAVYVPAAACPLVRNDEWAFRAEVLAACDAATPLPADDYDAAERGRGTGIA